MLGQSLFSYLTAAASHQISPSYATTPNLAGNLDHALRRAPFEKRGELENLCHWLVCCKHLWPAAAEMAAEAEPFSLHARNQSLHADPDCLEYAIHGLLNETNDDLMQDIGRYVLLSDRSHWQALRERDYPAASIDPADAPRQWPRECLAWALRTMDMRNADLFFANFEGWDLSGIDLHRADLQYACMDGANMRGANLGNAEIEGATFRNTDLTGADLTGLTFSTGKCNLKGAILNDALLDDIGLDIGPYETARDGAYALRKGLLPPVLDHLIRDNLRQHFREHDSDTDSDYLADFTGSETSDSEAA